MHNKIDKKQFVYNKSKKSEQPLLVGKLYDYLGNKLSPTYSYKYSDNGRYKMRYYINREIASKGKTLSEFKRIRSETIDNVVIGEMTIIQQILLDNISQSDNQEVSSLLLKPIKNMMIEPKDNIEKQYCFQNT